MLEVGITRLARARNTPGQPAAVEATMTQKGGACLSIALARDFLEQILPRAHSGNRRGSKPAVISSQTGGNPDPEKRIPLGAGS
jgi:hypothetical protein